ncbi:MAG TPA: hypothetical protein VME20_07280 [Acidimicrobiales bacterium]|nr:hypothetical protein [Acidimicrobiales bacterium]
MGSQLLLHMLVDARCGEAQEQAARVSKRRPDAAEQVATSPASGRRFGWREAFSAWLGFRMISLGCRLARPALVAGAQSNF